jgi:hypothetical protein
MADNKRNIRVDDTLWDRFRSLAGKHRRTVAGEVRVALEVYAVLAETQPEVIEEVLRGDRLAVGNVG